MEFFLMILNTLISKVWSSMSQAQRPLPTDIVRQRFPSLKARHNNGSSTRNSSRFKHPIRILNGGEIENVMLWLWLRRICWGLLSQCNRVCASSTSNPLAYRPRDLTFCFTWDLVHCDNKPLQNRSSTKLLGGYIGFTQSVRPASVPHPVSAL